MLVVLFYLDALVPIIKRTDATTQEAHGCVHLKQTMDIIHFLINANSIQIIVDAIIHRMTEEAMLLLCLVPALTIAVERVRRVVHLTMVPTLTTEVFVLLKFLINMGKSSESSMLFMTGACEAVLYYIVELVTLVELVKYCITHGPL
uniref:Uncharacterized protein n=1 Tax=Triticum urartu TaxID=4572 RepID=A0A8R7TYM7_TRIUA